MHKYSSEPNLPYLEIFIEASQESRRLCKIGILFSDFHEIRTSFKTDHPEVVKASQAFLGRFPSGCSSPDYLHSPAGFQCCIYQSLWQEVYTNASSNILLVLPFCRLGKFTDHPINGKITWNWHELFALFEWCRIFTWYLVCFIYRVY